MIRNVKISKELTACSYFEMTAISCGKLLTSSLAFCTKVGLKYCALYEIGTGMLHFFVPFEARISVYVGNEKAAVGCAAE